MKPCRQCTPSLLPWVLITLIASVVAFITWLTLGLSDAGGGMRVGAAAAAFAVVGLSLWQYMLSCIRRHCRHQDNVSSP